MTATDQLKYLKKISEHFIRFSRREIVINLFLSILQSMTAGIGLLMLIPLLQLIGVDSINSSESSILGPIKAYLATFGPMITLPGILILYILIIATKSWLQYFLSIRTARFQQSYICFMRDKVYRALLQSEWQFIAKNKMSDYANSLTRQIQIIGTAGGQLLVIVSQLVQAMIYIGLAFFVSMQMSAVVIAIAIFFSILVYPQTKKAFEMGIWRVEGMKSMFHMIDAQLGSLKMIKSYASENHHAKLFSSKSSFIEEQDFGLVQIKELTRLIQVVGGTVIFSIVFFISFSWFSVPLANLILLVLLFAGLIPKVTSIQNIYQQLLYKVSSFEEVESLLTKCLESQEIPSDNHINQPRLYKSMRLENVSFAYGGSNGETLSDLNLTIQSHTTTAIVGPSGVGKTTLADLIAGLLTPSFGSIYIDDVEVSGKNRQAWRKSLAYVTQETFLFHDTVRANLSWVRKEITEADIWEALTITRVADVVRSLPEGLDTSIGDRGVKLSGGERQRLAIARALLSNPALLILDEATNALDRESEEEIHSVLHNLRGKLTIIIIDHRGAMTQSVDSIIDLNNK